jgi:glycyl-tRNA synthetase
MEIETFIDPEQVNNCPAVEKVRDVVITFIDQKSQIEAREKDLEPPSGYDAKVGELLDKGEIINPYLAYYIGKEEIFYQSLGVPHKDLRFRHMLPEETPFYSKGNYDVEVKTSLGWKEVIGNAYRTDHDIKTHQEHSNTKLTFNAEGKKIIPHNIEPSFGVERAFYCTLEHAYVPEKTDREWSWFKFPKLIAPYFVHVYPLQKKPEELVKKSMEIFKVLKKKKMRVLFDEAASIGKRYQRADEIGTPYCITIDHGTIEDGALKETVTIRDRDTTKQIRVSIEKLPDILQKLYDNEMKFEEAGDPIA